MVTSLATNDKTCSVEVERRLEEVKSLVYDELFGEQKVSRGRFKGSFKQCQVNRNDD